MPEGRAGAAALSEKIKTADVRTTDLETTVSSYKCHASTPPVQENNFDRLQMCCEPYGTKLAIEGEYIKVIL